MLNVAETSNECFTPSAWQPFTGKHDVWKTTVNETITAIRSLELIVSTLETFAEGKKHYTQVTLLGTKHTKWRVIILERHLP